MDCEGSAGEIIAGLIRDDQFKSEVRGVDCEGISSRVKERSGALLWTREDMDSHGTPICAHNFRTRSFLSPSGILKYMGLCIRIRTTPLITLLLAFTNDMRYSTI